MRLEELARMVDAHVVAASVANALGAEVPVPVWDDVRDRFDAELRSPPGGDDDGKPDTPTAVMSRALFGPQWR